MALTEKRMGERDSDRGGAAIRIFKMNKLVERKKKKKIMPASRTWVSLRARSVAL